MLGDYLREARERKQYTLTRAAAECGISKQYLSDLEHGKRRLRRDTRIAVRIASGLDIPIGEISRRVESMTHVEASNFASYHRVLRSNTRASRAFALMDDLRKQVDALKQVVNYQRSVLQVAQDIETALDSLDATLAYNSRPPLENRPRRLTRAALETKRL